MTRALRFLPWLILSAIYWTGLTLTFPFRKTQSGIYLIKKLDRLDLIAFHLREDGFISAIKTLGESNNE